MWVTSTSFSNYRELSSRVMGVLMWYLQIVAIVTGVLRMYLVEGLSQDLMTAELLLKKYLLENYDPFVRPVKNASEPVVVTMDLALTQIVDVREKQQTIMSSVWLRFAWNDYFMRWNESKYEGVKTVHLKQTDVWTPDITLYTSVPTSQFSDSKDYLVKVTSDGSAYWYIPTRFVSTCKMDVQNFPYDVQNCKLKFGSWAYVSTELDLQNKSDSVDLAAYESNGEWELMSAEAIRHSITYNCCAEPYIDVTYYIKIKRKPLYYTFNVVLPCVFIVIVTPFSFLLSPGCGERIQLSITLLLSLTVFLLFVAEQLPVQSEDVPLVARYFIAAMLVLVFSNMASIISVHLYHRGSKRDKLPRMAKLLAIKMARLVCMADRFDDGIDKSSPDDGNAELKRYDHKLAKVENGMCHSTTRRRRLTSQKYKEAGSLDSVSGEYNIVHCPEECTIVQLVYDINSHLANLHEYKATSQKVDAIKREWKMVAIVLDRCLLFSSVMLIMLILLCFMIYNPEQD
ncbi:unnamed protein product [Owenia fusiformis]|uniref:Uncharacterized protein n=1 Tax=Owenia fusiformis TaxID=6347 RepID=A0A8S4PG91_OWEFU|nr:unnamed protein product [Owenia fusiformis]